MSNGYIWITRQPSPIPRFIAIFFYNVKWLYLDYKTTNTPNLQGLSLYFSIMSRVIFGFSRQPISIAKVYRYIFLQCQRLYLDSLDNPYPISKVYRYTFLQCQRLYLDFLDKPIPTPRFIAIFFYNVKGYIWIIRQPKCPHSQGLSLYFSTMSKVIFGFLDSNSQFQGLSLYFSTMSKVIFRLSDTPPHIPRFIAIFFYNVKG